MNKIMTRLKNRAGTSIMEVLVALFLAGLVTAAVFEIYISQHKNWMIQDDVTDIQQNARAAIDELARNVRMAGYALPFGLDAIEAYDTNPDTIIINYYSGNCEAVVELDMANGSSELHCDGHDISCFQDGQWAYIGDPGTGAGEFFQISQVNSGLFQIHHNAFMFSVAYKKGSKVMDINRVKYYIDYSDSLHPNLMVQALGQTPQVYAENIEDLQFHYKMKNGTVTGSPAIISNIREVEMAITARSSKPDQDFPGNPYRRRIYASKVNLRNLDI